MSVNMILLTRGENDGKATVQYTAAEYDMDEKQGKVLDEKPELLPFVTKALADMDDFAMITVAKNAVKLRDNDGGPTIAQLSDQQRVDLFLRFLAMFSELPMEFIGNCLAGMLVGCVEESMKDENLDTLVQMIEAGASAPE